MGKHTSPAHTGLNGKDIACYHCGKRETVIHGDGVAVNSPAWAGFIAHCQAFEDEHRGCKQTPESPTLKIEPDLHHWCRGLNVGISSATIFKVLHGCWPVGNGWRPGTPSDPADLGRCLRLLRIMPDWRPRLQEVADAYPAWQPLVDHWDELSALMEEEVGWDWSKGERAPRTYQRMKEVRGEA